MPESAKAKCKEFFQAGTLCRFQKGEIILHADEEPDGVYMIERGYVRIYSIRNTGDSNMHIIYKAGEIFPLIWTLRGRQLKVYYEAMDDVVLRRVSKEEFLKFVRGDLEMANLLNDYLVTVFWIYANRVENLGLGKAYDRVVYRLVFMMERFGKTNQLGEVVIDAPITQQDIADSVKMIRETASREIEKLENKGILTYRNHQIVILHPDRLKAELGESI